MTDRVWGEEYRTTLVCIDAYENGVPQGRFYNPWMKGERSFQNLTQFLLTMESTLEAMDFPKAFTVTRTFAPLSPEPETVPVPWEYGTGRIATFRIRILFRQNASWQGLITWLEGQQEQTFRSVLELILLMSTALSCSKAS